MSVCNSVGIFKTTKKLVEIKVETLFPTGSMYGTFTYIWLKLMVNVGRYTIHGSYGL